MAQPKRNTLTDISGIRVGHAHDARLASGVTVVMFDRPMTAAVDVRGGGPGTRETDLLDPAMTLEAIDAICLSGGSAFGLDSAAGVQAHLREHGRGYQVREALVPIVPGAILFDLLNGGDKNWGTFPPYRELGYAAAEAASEAFALGSVGAGFGATCVDLKGGVGSASDMTREGHIVGALAAANPVGSVVMGAGPHFWAAPFERAGEFGGRGWPSSMPAGALTPHIKGGAPQGTVLAIIATNAPLTKAQCKRLAMMAQTGLVRAIYPVHTPLDGDVVFAVSTASATKTLTPHALAELGAIAANTLSRAIARGVYEAKSLSFPGALPSWRDKFG